MTEFLSDKYELFRAAKFGNWSKVKEILSKNDEYLHVKDQNGQNFLHIATAENQIVLVQNAPAAVPAFDIRKEDGNGRTIAHIAAEKGYINFFKEVFIPRYKGEVDIIWNIKNSDDQSLLHWSAIGNHQEMTLFLLNHKLDANLLDKNNKTPIHYSIKHGVNDDFTIFYKFLKEAKFFNLTILHEAVLVESFELVENIIKAIQPTTLINYRDIDGNTPLITAIKAGNPEMAKKLIQDLDADVDVNEYYHSTRKETLKVPSAAHLAINKNYIGLFELIKEKSEQKNIAEIVDGANSTILHHAVSSGNLEAVKYVIENYPKIIDYKDTKYGTALNTAIRGKYVDIAIYLIKQGADANISIDGAGSPMDNAFLIYTKSNSKEEQKDAWSVIDLLLSNRNVHINTHDQLNAFGKNSALIESMGDVAESDLDENFINLLIAKGMNVNGFSDLPEENLLINACMEGKTKIVHILIKAGAKIFPKENQEEHLSEVQNSNPEDANVISEALNCGRIADSIYGLEDLDKSAKKISGDSLKNILFERVKTQLVKTGCPDGYDSLADYCTKLEQYISNKKIIKIVLDIEDFKGILESLNQTMISTTSVLNNLIEENKEQFSEEFSESDPYLVILENPDMVRKDNDLNKQIRQYISDLYRMPNTCKLNSLLEKFINEYPELRSNHIYTTEQKPDIEIVDSDYAENSLDSSDSDMKLSGDNEEIDATMS